MLDWHWLHRFWLRRSRDILRQTQCMGLPGFNLYICNPDFVNICNVIQFYSQGNAAFTEMQIFRFSAKFADFSTKWVIFVNRPEPIKI